MTTPSPAEQLASDISALQTRVGWMQDNVRLKNVQNAIEDLQTTLNNMPQRLVKLRAAGYVFEKYLEGQAAAFPQQWKGIHLPLLTQVNQQTASLQSSMRTIETKMTQLNGSRANISAARSLMSAIENEISMLEDKVRSAETTLNGMFDSFSSEVNSLDSHLNSIDYMLTQLAEAKFTLLPTEAGLHAVKAVWAKDVKERKEDPDGILFLTDQRLIFEQKEEIATKKFLFITTETQKVQELKWEIPVALVDQVTTSKQGLLKNEDHLDIRFKEGAPIETVHLHIWEECSEWLKLINRAKIRDFDKDRTVPIDQAVADKVKAIPSKCPSCGAILDQVVLRGQDSVKCEYCGFVIRI